MPIKKTCVEYLSIGHCVSMFHFSWVKLGVELLGHKLYFWGAPKSLLMVISAMKLRHLHLGSKAMTNLDSLLKSRAITLSTKVHLVKAWFFQ